MKALGQQRQTWALAVPHGRQNRALILLLTPAQMRSQLFHHLWILAGEAVGFTGIFHNIEQQTHRSVVGVWIVEAVSHRAIARFEHQLPRPTAHAGDAIGIEEIESLVRSLRALAKQRKNIAAVNLAISWQFASGQ